MVFFFFRSLINRSIATREFRFVDNEHEKWRSSCTYNGRIKNAVFVEV